MHISKQKRSSAQEVQSQVSDAVRVRNCTNAEIRRNLGVSDLGQNFWYFKKILTEKMQQPKMY